MGRHSDIEERIVSLLSHHREGLTLLNIAGALGIHRHTARKYVDILADEGAITQREVGQAKLCYLSESFKTASRPDTRPEVRPMVDAVWKRIGEKARIIALFVPTLIAGLPRLELPKRTARLGLIALFLVFVAGYSWFQATAYSQRIGVTYRVREDMRGSNTKIYFYTSINNMLSKVNKV